MSKQDEPYDLTGNIQEVLSVLETPGDTGKDNEPDEEARETIHVYPVAGGGVLFTKTPIEEPLDTAPIHTQNPKNAPDPFVIGVFFLSVLLPLSSIMLQLYLLFNPFVATLTIIPKSQEIRVTGTLQLGRELNPITLSQSQTTPTTGKGHQDAHSATGYITFYNGLFTSQTVPAGTALIGMSGEHVITDLDAGIPAANPPSLGYVTVSAHTSNSGSNGNIPADDINQACCATAIKAVNTASFSGGANERDFQIVTKQDITNTAAMIQTTLLQSTQGALQGELKNGEALATPTCTPTVTSDHQIGQEATAVKVTVSETCAAVAYTQDALKTQATTLLSHQAEKKLGTGFSLIGDVQIASIQATGKTLAFSCSGVWVYAVSDTAQQHIKLLIAGKPKQDALHLLLSLPDIERASIAWGDDTKLPRDSRYLHLILMYGL
jgi:hypothetical protein